MIDYKLALMTGADILFDDIKIGIHQPSILEISYLGESNFYEALSLLTLTKEKFFSREGAELGLTEKEISQITNFTLLSSLLEQQELAESKINIVNFLQLIFPNYKIFITPQSIILSGQETNIIDENNFNNFQLLLKEIFCVTNNSKDQQEFNPVGKKAKQIAEKLMKGREKIAEEKNGNGESNILTKYISILAVGLRYNINDICQLTLYQINDLMERYSLFINWDIDIKSRMAGASSDSEIEDWMKNIH